MTETLSYGITESQIYLDVPQEIFDTSINQSDAFEYAVNGRPANKRVIDAIDIDGGTRLVLNTRRTGRTKDWRTKHLRGQEMVRVFAEVSANTPEKQLDPNLYVELGTERIDDARIGTKAHLRWPIREDIEIQNLATQAMRRTAIDLRYETNLISDLVYAQVSRARGITLETNSIGSCSLDTDGDEYRSEKPIATLYAHNLYNHEMQIICLSGLIAIAQAQ